MSIRTFAASALAVSLAYLLAVPAAANVWVFEPSISLDQRFDDNYRLETTAARNVSTTRVVGDLGLSRQSQTARFRGAIRVDGLLTQDEFEGELRDSNRILFLDSTFRDQLTTWGIDLSYKEDTPSRDISADLGNLGSSATDNGIVTQSSDVARERFVVSPNVVRELTRRASVDATLTYTRVGHEEPSAQDAIYERYLGLYGAQNREDFTNDDIVPEAPDGSPLPIDEVDNDTVGVFTPDDELDDYQEAKIDLGYRYKLSPISTFSLIGSQSYYVADVVPADPVAVPFGDLDRDGQNDIYRLPRGREAISSTSSFRLGYDRNLTPTLRVGVQGGLYYNTTDDSDTFRSSDREFYRAPLITDAESGNLREQSADEYADSLETSENGWLANVRVTRDAGVANYSLYFGVDVQPSSIGSQVEAQELIGDYRRKLGPLLDFSFRARAYEPDRLGANPDDKFARRFLSLEPKIVWRFTRAWTASAAYRYRRQKSRTDPESGESNALLFSITYTPPSAIRDAANSL